MGRVELQLHISGSDILYSAKVIITHQSDIAVINIYYCKSSSAI